jgi:hypothetical protein
MGKPAFPPQGVGAPVLFWARRGKSLLHDGIAELHSLRLLDSRGGCPHMVPSHMILLISLLSQEEVCGDEEGEDYGDDAVHGEESGV